MKNADNKKKLTLLLVSSLTIMSVITISPALPQMANEFAYIENSEFLVKLVLTIPALMIAIFSPVTGLIIDKYGRLKILWIALLLYAVSGTGGYYLNDIYSILLSRALLGVAVGISMTVVITLVADYYEGMERQKFVGIQIAFMSIGGILFIGLGGILSDIGWKYPFLLYLFSLIILPLGMIYLDEPAEVVAKSSKATGKKPPIFLYLLFINTMVMWVLFFLIPVQIPFHLKNIGIEQNALIGAAIALSTMFSAVSSFLYNRIKNRFSFSSIFSTGYLLMAAAFFCISFTETFEVVLLAMMLAGLGMGMMIPNTNMWVMKIVPTEIRGREMGKLTSFWFFGQFISPIVTFPLLNHYSLSGTFLLTAGFLLLLSGIFIIFQITKVKAVTDNPAKSINIW